MENKILEELIPKGYELDVENSTFKFKKKEEIDWSIFKEDTWFYVNTFYDNTTIKWLYKGKDVPYKNCEHISYSITNNNIYINNDRYIAKKSDIKEFRLATKEELASFFERHPEYNDNKLPESWKELEKISGYCTFGDSNISRLKIISNTLQYDRNVFPTKEEAEASIALAQLCQLRDRYNNKPIKDWCNWTNTNQVKYTILFNGDKIIYSNTSDIKRVLTFKSYSLREKFMSCPEIVKLINLAKPLL